MNGRLITKIVTIAVFILSSSIFSVQSAPEQNENLATSEKQGKSELSQSLEALKAEVLALNRELFILEEDLLFPASTQIAVFVSVDIGHFLTLDSVEVKIDDQEVAGFLYTDRQRKALEQGGIQKIYLGNLKTGEHQLTAIFTGIDNEGRSVKRAANYTFEKEDDALMIEVKLSDNLRNNRAEVLIDEWIL
jgi:hypothetical protein